MTLLGRKALVGFRSSSGYGQEQSVGVQAANQTFATRFNK